MSRVCADEDRPVMQDCGQRLARILAMRGLKGPDLAERLGVHRSTVHGYLSGTIALSVPQLCRIAKIIEVPAALLLPADAGNPLQPYEELLLATSPELRQVYYDMAEQVVVLWRVCMKNKEGHHHPEYQ